jgi:hypothetical protein
LVVSQVKKGDEGAVQQSKEKMRVGAILASARHMIALNDVVQRQTQNVFIKMSRLFCIPGAISVMMQLLYVSRLW